MGVEWIITGDGFTWLSKDIDETTALAQHGWEIAKERISSGKYDLILLDEFTYPLHFGWLDTSQVLAWLRENRASDMHLIITGRNAPDALINEADLVTEMHLVKHPFEQGRKAQPGIEF
jgi:cob(I)alamin adenosyltransferase